MNPSEEDTGTRFALHCFNCKAQSPSAEEMIDAEKMAAEQGWNIGQAFSDADDDVMEANYACGDCTPLLLDPVSVHVP